VGFCREHDEQHLWATPIQAAMPKPEHITEAFRNLGTCFDLRTVALSLGCGHVMHRMYELDRFEGAIDPDSHSTLCSICSEPVPDF
jgi:hypothetical protein